MVTQGYVKIYFDAPDLKLMQEMIADLKNRMSDLKPLMADISSELAAIVDRHFSQGKGPNGKWKVRSPMTILMASRARNKKVKIHDGQLMRNTGKFQASFVPRSYKSHAKIGSSLKTKTGKNIGFIQHNGANIALTPKMNAWFKANFGIRLKVGTLVIPSRQVLYLEKSDREKMLNMLAKYIAETKNVRYAK